MRFRKDNRGYSLVELIVVVAMIAVLVTGISLSISIIYNSNARAGAYNIRSEMADLKVYSMSKDASSARMKLYRSSYDGDVYAQLQHKEGGSWEDYRDPQKVATRKVTVTCVKKDGSLVVLDGGAANYICMAFDRGTGSMIDTVDDTVLVDKIIVEGGHKKYTLILYALTGKVEVINESV